jgi:uncharacterized protein (DUF488 family)
MLKKSRPLVLTIGHSNRSLDEFIALIKANEVACMADVRKMPRSRHNPQFNQDTLPHALGAANIDYAAMPGLGGLRRRIPDSVNTGWRNPSFQGFADYMQTPEFTRALEVLIDRAHTQRLAIMCAEAVPWRCHRSLIADALAIRKIAVEDIIGPGPRQPHRLTPWSHVEGTRITYPEEGGSLFF